MKLSAIAVLFIGLQISACSQIRTTVPLPDPAANPTPSVVRPQMLIAQDFVHVLQQLSGMQAASTTVSALTSDQDDDFTQTLLDALEQAGYGTRWVAQKQGYDTVFTYSAEQQQVAGGIYRDTYELAVGSVEMRRSYARESQQRVRPVTPLYVRGADASNVVLNDTIFDQVGVSTTSAATGATAPAGALEPVPQSSSKLQVPADANPLNPLVGRAAAAPSLARPLLSAPSAQNVFDLGGSNFQHLLSNYFVVSEQVLTFANDSMRLGPVNKQLINQLVESFDPQSDIFSLIGCSMGTTQVEGGNAALALGRANRVAEALQFAGVDNGQILDEGCWAGDETLYSLPRRGVVLTLNRRT